MAADVSQQATGFVKDQSQQFLPPYLENDTRALRRSIRLQKPTVEVPRQNLAKGISKTSVKAGTKPKDDQLASKGGVTKNRRQPQGAGKITSKPKTSAPPQENRLPEPNEVNVPRPQVTQGEMEETIPPGAPPRSYKRKRPDGSPGDATHATGELQHPVFRPAKVLRTDPETKSAPGDTRKVAMERGLTERPSSQISPLRLPTLIRESVSCPVLPEKDLQQLHKDIETKIHGEDRILVALMTEMAGSIREKRHEITCLFLSRITDHLYAPEVASKTVPNLYSSLTPFRNAWGTHKGPIQYPWDGTDEEKLNCIRLWNSILLPKHSVQSDGNLDKIQELYIQKAVKQFRDGFSDPSDTMKGKFSWVDPILADRQLTRAQEEFEDMEAQMQLQSDQSAQDCELLRREIREKVRLEENASRKIQKLEEQISKLTDQVRSAKKEVSASERAIGERYQSEIQLLREQFEDERRQFEVATTEELGSLRDLLKNRDGHVDLLKEENLHLRHEQQRLLVSVEEKERQVKSVEEAKLQLESEQQQLLDALNKKTQQVQSLEDKTVQLGGQLEVTVKQGLETLEASRKDQERRIQSLEREKLRLQGENQQLQEDRQSTWQRALAEIDEQRKVNEQFADQQKLFDEKELQRLEEGQIENLQIRVQHGQEFALTVQRAINKLYGENQDHVFSYFVNCDEDAERDDQDFRSISNLLDRVVADAGRLRNFVNGVIEELAFPMSDPDDQAILTELRACKQARLRYEQLLKALRSGIFSEELKHLGRDDQGCEEVASILRKACDARCEEQIGKVRRDCDARCIQKVDKLKSSHIWFLRAILDSWDEGNSPPSNEDLSTLLKNGDMFCKAAASELMFIWHSDKKTTFPKTSADQVSDYNRAFSAVEEMRKQMPNQSDEVQRSFAGIHRRIALMRSSLIRSKAETDFVTRTHEAERRAFESREMKLFEQLSVGEKNMEALGEQRKQLVHELKAAEALREQHETQLQQIRTENDALMTEKVAIHSKLQDIRDQYEQREVETGQTCPCDPLVDIESRPSQVHNQCTQTDSPPWQEPHIVETAGQRATGTQTEDNELYGQCSQTERRAEWQELYTERDALRERAVKIELEREEVRRQCEESVPSLENLQTVSDPGERDSTRRRMRPVHLRKLSSEKETLDAQLAVINVMLDVVEAQDQHALHNLWTVLRGQWDETKGRLQETLNNLIVKIEEVREPAKVSEANAADPSPYEPSVKYRALCYERDVIELGLKVVEAQDQSALWDLCANHLTLNKNLYNVKAELGDAKKEVTSLREANMAKKVRFNELESKLRQARDRCVQSKVELAALRTEKEEATEKVPLSDHTPQSLLAETEALRNKLIEVQFRLEETRKTVTAVTKEARRFGIRCGHEVEAAQEAAREAAQEATAAKSAYITLKQEEAARHSAKAWQGESDDRAKIVGGWIMRLQQLRVWLDSEARMTLLEGDYSNLIGLVCAWMTRVDRNQRDVLESLQQLTECAHSCREKGKGCLHHCCRSVLVRDQLRQGETLSH